MKHFSSHTQTFTKWYGLFLVFGMILWPTTSVKAAELADMRIDSVSTESISLFPEPTQKTIAIYGSGLEYILFNPVNVNIGTVTATNISGNGEGLNLSFELARENFTAGDSSTTITVTDQTSGAVLYTAPMSMTVYNPTLETDTSPHTRKYLKQTNVTQRTKRTIGLNTHQALAAQTDSEDDLYETKLDQSNTVWVREHISYAEVMGDNQQGWLNRYDHVFAQHQAHGRRVVAMLAYGETDDSFTPPSKEKWAEFMNIIVPRYRGSVDAWEVWNEPDSPDYISVVKLKAIRPLLKVSYPIIKQYDPTSLVLFGGIADITHKKFIKEVYKYNGAYFDRLAIHFYTCRQWQASNYDHSQILSDVAALKKIVPKNRRKQKFWVTELGCSTGSPSIGNSRQYRYLKTVTKKLLMTGNVQVILLYSFRDRPYMDDYERYFGLLTDTGTAKTAWKWYANIKSQ